MKRRQFLGRFLAGSALAAQMACTRRGPETSLRKLRVAAARRLTTSTLHLANELGFFRDAGFDIEILQAGGPAPSMALLAGGKVDAFLGSVSTALLNAVAKGLPLYIVAGRELASVGCGNFCAIYGMRRTFPNGLDDLKQLKGKRVATGLSLGVAQFALEAHLSRAGLSPVDVTTVNLDFRQDVPALLGGGVDAIIVTDDFDRDVTSLSPEIVHSPGLASIYPDFQYSYIMFGQTLIEGNPDVGARFLAAYCRGAREFARGKSPRFMTEFAKANHFEMADSPAVCRGKTPVDGAIDMNSLRLFSEWAARKKHVPRLIDTSEYVTTRFLKRIHES